MKPPVPAIPTMYRGIQMRSRTEARWAAFFDELRWPWQYESLDLDGWIPDFILRLGHRDIAVDVKPFLHLAECAEMEKKIEQSRWHGEALVTLAMPWPSETCSILTLGSYRQIYRGHLPEPEICRFSEGVLGYCRACGGGTIFSQLFLWTCARCGDGDKQLFCWPDEGSPSAMWARASNAVQWLPLAGANP